MCVIIKIIYYYNYQDQRFVLIESITSSVLIANTIIYNIPSQKTLTITVLVEILILKYIQEKASTKQRVKNVANIKSLGLKGIYCARLLSCKSGSIILWPVYIVVLYV